jgi:GNAT superfamily N-acetyltransferase
VVDALSPGAYQAAIPQLADLVVDAVESGAAVNFLAGVRPDEAAAWWQSRSAGIADGSITLFVAVDRAGRIVGSTLLMRSTNQNSPHRAEIGKVIVRRDARRRGLGRRLMEAAESTARDEGRWLLFLDTESGSEAEQMYRALGWHEAGTIPDYAMSSTGIPAPATWYWKDLR